MPATDEDIVRDLLHRCTADVYPDVLIAAGVAARQRRRARRRRAVSAVAAGAALGTAAGLVALVPAGAKPGGGAASSPGLKLTASQRVLYQLSAAAGRQQPGQGRYVVLSEKEDGNLDTSIIDSATGDMWSYQEGYNGAPSGAGKVSRHWSPTAAEFAAMPLDPAALRTNLLNRFNETWQQQADSTPQAAGQGTHHGTHAGPRLVPLNEGPPGSPDDRVFQQAMDYLWNPLTPPALRAALFRVLAGTPGVKVDRTAHDTAGRVAVRITWTSRDKTVYTAYEDPRTGAVLELTYKWPPSLQGGQGYDLMESVTRTATIPPDPYSG